MLQRIYQRITYKRVYYTDNESVREHFPRLQVGFPLEEKRINETVVRGGTTHAKEDEEWLECASNESMDADYDYDTKNDDEQMKAIRIKRKKKGGAHGIDYGIPSQVQLSIKDPFIFNEDVLYPELNDPRFTDVVNKTIYDVVLPLNKVYPFGYPTEQLFRQLKQDIHNKLEEHRALVRNGTIPEDTEAQGIDKDPGLLANETGIFQEIPIQAWGLVPGGVTMNARITDTLFNNYRKQLRDGVNMALRLYSAFPKSGGRSRGRTTASKDEPSLEINKFGYNPSLERRLAYKFLPVASMGGEHQFINVNYILDHPDFETAYRSDVHRIETKGKMSIKEIDEIRREEEFNNVETTYKHMRKVMLQKKFETFLRDRIAADQTEQRRW